MMLACRVDVASARPPSPGDLMAESEESGSDGREYADKLVALLRAHGGGLLCLQQLRRTANIEVQRAAHRQLREQLARRLWSEVLAQSSRSTALGCLRASVEMALGTIFASIISAPISTRRAFGRWVDGEVRKSIAGALQCSGPCKDSIRRTAASPAPVTRPRCCSVRPREREGDFTRVG